MGEQLKFGFLDEATNQVDQTARSLKPLKKLLDDVRKGLERSDALPLPVIEKAVGRLERGATDDVRRAAPDVVVSISRAQQELERVARGRENVDQRREELARAAKARGWQTSHTSTSDYIGQFEIRHTANEARVRMGSVVVATLKKPGVAQIIDLLEATRQKLEAEATQGWDDFASRLETVQRELSPTDPVAWKALLERGYPDKKLRLKLQKVLFYRLAMMISGRAPGGWLAAVANPVLAEQRQSIDVPRLDQPGQIVRVNRIRISRSER